MTTPDLDKTEMWLRSLARDVLEHERCAGCKQNAATALEHLGLLDEVLAKLELTDPRERPPTHESGGYRSTFEVDWHDPEQPG